MKLLKVDFYCGIITALNLIALHDEQSLYEELVDLCDLSELVEVAKLNEELEFSGLIQYGYVNEKGKILKR